MISQIKAPTDDEMKIMMDKLHMLVSKTDVTRKDAKEIIKEVVPTFIDLND
jgi:hypothetical protein